MKVLVTGSGGLLGKQVVGLLKDKKCRVIECTRSAGCDIKDADKLKGIIKGVDAVVHLAGVLDEGSGELWKVNVEGTKNVLEAAAEAKVGHFVFASTVGVMGDIEGEVDESAGLNPKTPYEKSKAEAEKLVMSYQEVLPVTVLRVALVCGPNKYWAKIIDMVEGGMPIVGSGKNHWQIVDYRDAASAFVFLLGKEDTFGEVFIVAGEEKPTLEELYRKVSSLIGGEVPEKKVGILTAKAGILLRNILGKRDVRLAHIDRLVRERNYNTNKIKGLGWEQKYSLEQSLKDVVSGLGK